jgi:hypothetical protein
VERAGLVSPRTRRAFREHLVGWPLRAIQDLFENEGIQLGQGSPAVTGQRRSLVERYYATVDWTAPQEVRRVLRAYEHILADADLPAPTYGELKRYLEWDGYTMDATGRLRSPPAGSRSTSSWSGFPGFTGTVPSLGSYLWHRRRAGEVALWLCGPGGGFEWG